MSGWLPPGVTDKDIDDAAPQNEPDDDAPQEVIEFADWREIRDHLAEIQDRYRRMAEEDDFNEDRDANRRKIRESSEWLLDNDTTWLECFLSVIKERLGE